jgi:hypothetical protein
VGALQSTIPSAVLWKTFHLLGGLSGCETRFPIGGMQAGEVLRGGPPGFGQIPWPDFKLALIVCKMKLLHPVGERAFGSAFSHDAK